MGFQGIPNQAGVREKWNSSLVLPLSFKGGKNGEVLVTFTFQRHKFITRLRSNHRNTECFSCPLISLLCSCSPLYSTSCQLKIIRPTKKTNKINKTTTKTKYSWGGGEARLSVAGLLELSDWEFS